MNDPAPSELAALPAYYHGLAPFKRLFETGLPVLTYHKLGPRPRRVRLKGLYLSVPLFERQLRELRASGFAAGSLDAVGQATHRAAREVVLTFDDGFQNVLQHGLEPLAGAGFQAIQFLVADLIGGTNEWEQREGEARESLMDGTGVREWLAAGHAIGSHTRTHPRLTTLPRAQAREEIAGSRKALEDRFGIPIRHFCYPYGDWNEAVRDLVQEAGYRTACTVERGVNPPGASPFSLKRFTARYPSRNLKAVLQRGWASWRGWGDRSLS